MESQSIEAAARVGIESDRIALVWRDGLRPVPSQCASAVRGVRTRPVDAVGAQGLLRELDVARDVAGCLVDEDVRFRHHRNLAAVLANVDGGALRRADLSVEEDAG